jgi:hypothetical protein
MSRPHSNCIYYTMVTVIGSFLAIIISSFISIYLENNFNLDVFIKKGEPLIICASLLISAVYNFYTFKREFKNGWPTACFWLSILIFFICVAFYTIISNQNGSPKLNANGIKTNGSTNIWLTYLTLAISAVTILFTYLSQYYQNINTDIITSRDNDRKNLEDKLANIRG